MSSIEFSGERALFTRLPGLMADPWVQTLYREGASVRLSPVELLIFRELVKTTGGTSNGELRIVKEPHLSKESVCVHIFRLRVKIRPLGLSVYNTDHYYSIIDLNEEIK